MPTEKAAISRDSGESGASHPSTNGSPLRKFNRVMVHHSATPIGMARSKRVVMCVAIWKSLRMPLDSSVLYNMGIAAPNSCLARAPLVRTTRENMPLASRVCPGNSPGGAQSSHTMLSPSCHRLGAFSVLKYPCVDYCRLKVNVAANMCEESGGVTGILVAVCSPHAVPH